MADLGFFQGQHVELIDGEIIQMAPQKDVHAVVIGLAQRAADEAFGSAFWVREQLPLSLPDNSEPEPDLSVVAGNPRDYLGTGHPKTALLVIEVSDTTLPFDRNRKASLYAAAGIADYWIINLMDRQLEVLRQPIADASAPHGLTYGQTQILKSGEAIAPLAAPTSQIAVTDLLP